MKTATIETYEMHGTRGGRAARVTYRGRLLYEISGNHPAAWLAARAVQYAVVAHGCTHARIDNGITRRAVSAAVGEGMKEGARGAYHIGIAADDRDRTPGFVSIYRA
ncbi:hypothetical protein H1O16_gp069 [Burkholderia phage BcepSaruman]|uniref:Uncharacterized protein n=1 Tax=Burkholderia phage BcepSaruman TaxID=2530032 RepID=A0A4D5ZG49_9CAUD|nr:hypothetical protein H1O16_gp069 [Burkholderia phage BcepSaruman]QBX06482.1 hypothetical protein BcepSaruman_069 [Burkholderia phage BcepSaruman]